jgi:hypothetical protein
MHLQKPEGLNQKEKKIVEGAPRQVSYFFFLFKSFLLVLFERRQPHASLSLMSFLFFKTQEFIPNNQKVQPG